MPQLRLIDPNGYDVAGATRTVTDDQVEAVTANLLTEVAAQDADSWAQYGHPYTARQYRVRVVPDPLPTTAQELVPLVAAEQAGQPPLLDRLTVQLGDARQARQLLADAYTTYAAQLRTAA